MYQEIKTKFNPWSDFSKRSPNIPAHAVKTADGRGVYRPVQKDRVIDWVRLDDGSKIFIEQWGEFLIAANCYSKLTGKPRAVYNDQPFNVIQYCTGDEIKYSYSQDGMNPNIRVYLRSADLLADYHPWTQLLEPEEARWPVRVKKSDNP